MTDHDLATADGRAAAMAEGHRMNRAWAETAEIDRFEAIAAEIWKERERLAARCIDNTATGFEGEQCAHLEMAVIAIQELAKRLRRATE